MKPQSTEPDTRQNSTQIERRAFDIQGLEIRAGGDEPGQVKISGHAAVFNSLSEELWGFREKIAPGAFADSLGKDDIRALWNHDPSFVLGRNRAGTLSLREDATGLAVEIQPPDTQWARDLMVTIKRGDVSQMSFGFVTIDDEWKKENGNLVRTLIRAQLFDVSPVTFPAYTQTDVSVRSAMEAIAETGRRRLDIPTREMIALRIQQRKLDLDLLRY